ncbi:D-inositol-3-phosphate glycosyltransferase [Paraconexibacter sp. AEG42_29]|uniref:D-inositol-3-phosphate glycosyltransferase n=1 Tax=Paraconexibacter sp. AEG42_29 TaxID=2997339 RepID=A0AAU7B1V5_9ACTN
MALTVLSGGQRLDGPDGSVAVVIPLYNQHELFTQCLTSVLAHTPADVAILVADDASPDTASQTWVQELADGGHLHHDVYWLRAETNSGFVGNCNSAFAATGRADVILLNSDCVVAAGWVEGLRGALASDGSLATATALTNHGSIVSVPVRNTPVAALPQHIPFDKAAREVMDQSRRLYPRLPTAIGHCVLVRRSALDLVGPFDEAFAPGYGEEVDFSQRCIAAGLQHVLADDVLVLHQGGGTFGAGGASKERTATQIAHEKLINIRYPAYRDAVREAESGVANPLARSLAIASAAILGPRVTVDVRCLGPYLTGTQVHALELVHALWRTQGIQLRLFLPDEVGAYAQPVIDSMVGIETLRESDVGDGTRKDPIVHRPFQLSSLRDLSLLDSLGERLVVTHQDLIAYRNPQYFDSPAHWEHYRALTAEALATATMTLFFSQHAADDAEAENLVPANRIRVAHLGVDHQLDGLQIAPRTPPFADRLADAPFLLCVGTSFKHKNRVFAIKLLEALREKHGWNGRLVFCGAHVVRGSSAGLEAEYLASRPELNDAVLDVSAVDESEKRWLFANTAAVVYPTTYEGFGLVPFEAAASGVPCIFAHVSSLMELLPAELATITPWDPSQTAARVLPLLAEGHARAQHVEALRGTAAGLTWDQTAAKTLAAYRDALAFPDRDLARVHRQRIPDARYWGLRHAIGGTGMSLVGPPDPLLPEATQRALAALAKRPKTRGLLLKLLGLLAGAGGKTNGSSATPAAGIPAGSPSVGTPNGATTQVAPPPEAPDLDPAPADPDGIEGLDEVAADPREFRKLTR